MVVSILINKPDGSEWEAVYPNTEDAANELLKHVIPKRHEDWTSLVITITRGEQK